MKKKRLISLLLAMILIFSLLAGCGSSTSDTSGEDESSTAEASEASEESEDTDGLPEDYPMISEDGITINAFSGLNPNLTSLVEDYSELDWRQELAVRTGVSFEWNVVSAAAEEDQFNLLVAAGDLPALVCVASYYTDSEGITSAVENEVFVDIAGYLEDYAPDYLEIISQDDVYPLISDDNGSIVGFYEIAKEEFPPNNGVFIHGDLLEEQGLDLPVTYEEYEETLLALKNAYDITYPIFEQDGYIEWLAYSKGIMIDFTLDADGNLVYGPLEDACREYLTIANRWYEEGLIYQDYYSVVDSNSALIELMSTEQSIMAFSYVETMGEVVLPDEDDYFVPSYLPRENEGDEVHLTSGIDKQVATSRLYSISTNATEEEILTICMLMNYLYTEEGSLFLNYGVEGVSFEYDENGDPWYTDLILDNPDGLTTMQALLTYIGDFMPGLSDYTKYNLSAMTAYPEFIEVWADADNDWALPDLSLTVEESEEYSAVASDVETYLDECMDKFITGAMDINDDDVWQEYLDTMEAMGVNTMIEIYSAALERYNERMG